MGPEDYTPDFLTDTQRKEEVLIVRAIGTMVLQPFWNLSAANFSNITWKSLIYTEGDESVEDGAGNDPAQYQITDPQTYVDFCREHNVMNVHPLKSFVIGQEGGLQSPQYSRHSHPTIATTEWDMTLKRKVKTDGALWLLVAWENANSLSGENILVSIDVDSRVLIHD